MTPHRRLNISILIAIVLLMPAVAAASEYLIRPITLDHGLSQSSVRCVLRDRMGYLWIGTDFGLNRYDNNKVVRYYYDSNKTGSITDHRVEFLVTDPDGDVLVGLSHGLVKYNYATDSFEEITDNGKRIDGQSARTTKDGVLIGGYGKLYFYQSGEDTVTQLPTKGGATSAYMSISAPWNPGVYILQTRWDGLWLYDSAYSVVQRLPFCSESNITAVEVDQKGNLWVAGYDRGLVCYNHQGNIIKRINAENSALSSNIVYALAQWNGKIWAGSEQGIDLINPGDFVVTNLDKLVYGPKNCTILCLSTDRHGAMYAGTLRHGVLCIYKVPMRTFNNIDGHASFFGFTVTSMIPALDSNKVWVGLDGEGVALFDPAAETFEIIPGTGDMKVTSLTYYDKDHLIVASYNDGIKLLNVNTKRLEGTPLPFRKIKEHAHNKTMAVDLYRLNDGRILSITDELLTINPNSSEPTDVKFTGIRSAQEKLNPLFCDGKVLLVSDKHNVYRYVAGPDTCGVVYSVKPAENITAATYDGKENLWVATNKKFLRQNLETGFTKEFKTDLVQNITSLALEGDKVWIGADNKLFLGSPDGAITVFGPNDGVAPNQFLNKARLLTNEHLLLGGVNGLLKVNRGDIRELLAQSTEAEISVSDVLVDNSRVIMRDGVAKIPHSHSIVNVNIVDTDLGGVGNKLFRYYVEGLKRALVVETFDRSLSLNMLPSGKYKILVSYRLNNGEWSTPEALLELEIAASMWGQWWAICIYVALLACAAVFIYLYYKNKRRRRIEELHQNTLQDKVNFLTKLHAELRVPLTLILSPLKSLIDKVKKESHEEGNASLSTLEDIYNNSIEMRNIIEALPESKDLVHFSKDKDHKETEPQDSSKEDKEKDQGLLSQFDTTPYTAIVVEENERLRAFMVSHLQSLFKKVEVAKTAKDAMIKIKDTHPDIIIADVDLFKENGYEFCREIKNTPDLCHIPVILLTSGNSLGQKRKSYAYGADSYISKPFDIDMLITRCKNLLLNRAIMRRRYEKETPADKMATKVVANSDESFLLQLDRILAENLADPSLGVDFLTKRMLLSRTTFYQRMKQLTGKSIGQYIADYRLAEAKKMLKMNTLSINDISEALGFSSQRYFSTFFKDKTGLSPTEFRAQ